MSADFHIATGLAKIGTYLRSQNWRQAESEQLTPTQSQIVVHLVQRGPARITVLADELGVTQPTASDAAAALIRKGHVDRRSDPTDARASLLHSTKSGRHVAKKMAVWPDALLAATDALEPGERAIFLKALTKLIRSLQIQGAIPVQRMCATCQFFRPNIHDDSVAPHHCDFVDAAFGDIDLRLDCGEHEMASDRQTAANWQVFASAEAKRTDAPTATTGEAS